MGYSASVACKSIKARDGLANFLENNLVSWSELTKNTKLAYHPDYDYTRFICVGDDLSYGSSVTRVGFNFSTQNEPGDYMWAILNWSALRYGRRAKFPKLLGHSMGVKYVTYDGYDHIPVILPQDASNNKEKYIVDYFGCPLKNPKHSMLHSLLFNPKLKWNIIRNAMKELDEKWKNR